MSPKGHTGTSMGGHQERSRSRRKRDDARRRREESGWASRSGPVKVIDGGGGGADLSAEGGGPTPAPVEPLVGRVVIEIRDGGDRGWRREIVEGGHDDALNADDVLRLGIEALLEELVVMARTCCVHCPHHGPEGSSAQ